MDLMESSERALHIAILILDNGTACDIGELRQRCCLFPVSSHEIHHLCALQDSPLQVLRDKKIGLAANFLLELRSRLKNFRGTRDTAPGCNGQNILVPALPSASMVDPLVKGEGARDLDVKEVRRQA